MGHPPEPRTKSIEVTIEPNVYTVPDQKMQKPKGRKDIYINELDGKVRFRKRKFNPQVSGSRKHKVFKLPASNVYR